MRLPPYSLALSTALFLNHQALAAVIGDPETKFTAEYGSAIEVKNVDPGVVEKTYPYEKNGVRFHIRAFFFQGICHWWQIESQFGRPLDDATIKSWLEANSATEIDPAHSWVSMSPKSSQPPGTKMWVRRDSRYEVVLAEYHVLTGPKYAAHDFWNLEFKTGKALDWLSK